MKKIPAENIKAIQKLYKSGVVTPVNLVNNFLNRAEYVKDLNAFIKLTPDTARDCAAESEKRLQSSEIARSLEGVPVAVKDNFCTEDIPTTCASKMLENFVPTYNATVYQRLKDAGAVLMGKTNLDEFAMGSGTVDSIFGPTYNLWGSKYVDDMNTGGYRIAGGSSGGSAVAVASGSCVAAIGSDTGGSTRNPAALCGVVGFKPTYGTVSRYGLIPLVNSMDVPGVMASTVTDCATIFNCIAGFDLSDSTTINHTHDQFDLPHGEEISLKNVKIGIPNEYVCSGMSPEVLSLWTEVADLLDNEGAKISRVSMPNTSSSIAVYSVLNQCEVASNMARYDGVQYGLRSTGHTSTEELYAASRSSGFNEVVRARIFAGNYFLLRENYNKYFMQALKLRRLISDDFHKVFHKSNENRVNLLLTPTTLSDAPLYEDFIKKTNRDQCAHLDYCTQPANMAGVPAISIPIKLSKKKLPLSLQLMGPMLCEKLLFTLAKKIEHMVKFPTLSFNYIGPSKI